MHATSTKDQQNTIPAVDRHSPAGFKPKTLKSLGWDYFGLFRPQFKYGLQQKKLGLRERLQLSNRRS